MQLFRHEGSIAKFKTERRKVLGHCVQIEQKKEQAVTGQTWKQWCEEQKGARPCFPNPDDCRKYALIARYPGAYKAGDSIKEAYKQAGFDSFADYMNERQPCGIKKVHAYRLIAAMKLRPLLPEVSAADTEYTIRPLLHKDFTPADQKRIGKKSRITSVHGTCF